MRTLNPYVLAVIVLRLSGYILILFNPLYGMLVSFLFDMLDFKILEYGKSKKNYHNLDKPLDYLEYLFLIPVLLHTDIFNIYMFFLIFRTIGHILYAKTRKQWVFFIFPNIAEYIAFLYLLSKALDWNIDVTSLNIIIYIVFFKLIQEGFLHIYKPWKYGSH